MTAAPLDPAAPLEPRSRAARRRWALAALIALVLSLAVIGSCSWYLTGRIEGGALRPDRDAPTLGLEVLAVTEDTVRLRAFDDSNANRGGIWALEWHAEDRSGWVQVGPIVEAGATATESVRPMLYGTPPPVGAAARLDNRAFLGTPLELGLDYEVVEYEAGLGPAAAWLVCEGRSRWLIHVHGKDGDPLEMMRMLPTVTDLGFTTLSISYTNDLDAPTNEANRYGYGADEWRDVEGAVRHALDRGATEIVLAGHSMGGAIVASFLVESALVSSVEAAILESPMLDLRRTVALGLSEGGVPRPLQPLPIWLTGLRFDLDWDRLDYAGRSDEFVTPLLIFHGTDDDRTPIEASDRLAAARPDLVTYERVEGAHHTGAWNVDPARHEAALRAFVTSTLGPPPRTPSCAP